MAERLHLFASPREELVASHFGPISPDMESATAHIARGIYNLLTWAPCSASFPWRPLTLNSLRSIFYREEMTVSPPPFSIPGSTNYIECKIPRVNWPAHLLPSYVGEAFTAYCEFWLIIGQISTMCYGEDTALKHHVSLAFAESIYQQLLVWSDGLAPDSGQDDIGAVRQILLR